MRLLLQRVAKASVTVDGSVTGAIGRGYLLFLGVMEGDAAAQAEWLAQKVIKLRLFDSDDGAVNRRTLAEVGGSILVVPQFTLAGSVTDGNRPDYTGAARPEVAQGLYEAFILCLREQAVDVQTGVFGAHMQVELVNDGPVTLVIDR